MVPTLCQYVRHGQGSVSGSLSAAHLDKGALLASHRHALGSKHLVHVRGQQLHFTALKQQLLCGC